MIQNIIKLLVIGIILVGIYFAAAMFIAGVWIKLTAALLILVFILAAVRLFGIDV